jgi:hypothetical protein
VFPAHISGRFSADRSNGGGRSCSKNLLPILERASALAGSMSAAGMKRSGVIDPSFQPGRPGSHTSRLDICGIIVTVN